MSKLPLFTVDAFTNVAFAGNPAAVCLVSKQEQKNIITETMQKIATEMNISETCFISEMEKDSFKTGSRFGLRWFTPVVEIGLCGHATLASAAVLFNCCENIQSEIHFETLSGVLTVTKNSNGQIKMSLPENKTVPIDSKLMNGVVELMFPGNSMKPTDFAFSPGDGKLVVAMPDTYSRGDLESLRFDVSRLMACTPQLDLFGGEYKKKNMIGVIVTVRGGPNDRDDKGQQYDFFSRFFAPWVGVNEDPVCGSAHTVLACYWSPILKKTSFLAHQCSARGGDLHVTLISNEGQGRVEISGDSVVVLKGEITIK